MPHSIDAAVRARPARKQTIGLSGPISTIRAIFAVSAFVAKPSPIMIHA